MIISVDTIMLDKPIPVPCPHPQTSVAVGAALLSLIDISAEQRDHDAVRRLSIQLLRHVLRGRYEPWLMIRFPRKEVERI